MRWGPSVCWARMNPSPTSPTRWVSGTTMSVKSSSHGAMLPIVGMFRTTVKPGVSLSTTKHVMPCAGAEAAGTARWPTGGASARGSANSSMSRPGRDSTRNGFATSWPLLHARADTPQRRWHRRRTGRDPDHLSRRRRLRLVHILLRPHAGALQQATDGVDLRVRRVRTKRPRQGLGRLPRRPAQRSRTAGRTALRRGDPDRLLLLPDRWTSCSRRREVAGIMLVPPPRSPPSATTPNWRAEGSGGRPRTCRGHHRCGAPSPPSATPLHYRVRGHRSSARRPRPCAEITGRDPTAALSARGKGDRSTMSTCWTSPGSWPGRGPRGSSPTSAISQVESHGAWTASGCCHRSSTTLPGPTTAVASSAATPASGAFRSTSCRPAATWCLELVHCRCSTPRPTLGGKPLALVLWSDHSVRSRGSPGRRASGSERGHCDCIVRWSPTAREESFTTSTCWRDR